MRFFILVAAAMFFSSPSFAVLGQKSDSIANDKKVMAFNQENKTSKIHYSIHAISNERTKVREFSGNDGMVFGVAWDSNSHPNLKTLMGDYYSEYQAAFKERRKKFPYRKPYTYLKTKNLVVKMYGHFGFVHGRVYAPSLIPQGVSVDDIK